jgi:UDP-glucose 4-epimerase
MAVINGDINGTFNVGTGKETSVHDLFNVLVEHTGTQAKPIYGARKEGEQLRSCLDHHKLSRTFGWEPSVSLKEGLIETIKFFGGN